MAGRIREERSARPLKRVAAGLGLSLASLAILFGAFEGLLRVAPEMAPRGSYFGSGVYEPAARVYLPRSDVLYNRGSFVLRSRNRAGFMDGEHALEKAEGTVRVGIFGDSYVESVQVPLEEVFFRRLPRRMAGRDVEPLAFGVSGTGTLNSLVLYRWLADVYALDVVVYVFVANDITDNSYEIQRTKRGTLTPELTARPAPNEDGFEAVWPPPPGELGPLRRLAMAAKEHSLVARILLSRMQLLVKGGGADAARDGEGPTVPAAEDRASLRRARELTERILDRFAREVRADGRDFLVVYTPQGDRELAGALGPAATWKPWLASRCEALGVPLVDVTGALRERFEAGVRVYGDHWTPAGHRVVAQVLHRALEARLEEANGAESGIDGGERESRRSALRTP